jgi:hypothetical protein
MDNFWKWLMRANAHAVFFSALAGLLLVCGWWTWKELSPDQDVMPLTPSSSRDRAADGLGLTTYLDKEVDRDVANLPPDPFAYDQSSKLFQPMVATQQAPVVVAVKAPPPPAAHTPPAVKTHAPPAAPVRQLTALTYRGLMKRTDGRTLALVQDSKTGKTRFYQVGEKLDALSGIRIEKIDERTASVLDVAGQPIQLKFGEPVSFEEGRHAAQ